MAKILVVDDEPDLRETVKKVLEKKGYKVITAVNGDDCLKKLKAQKVNMVLLDIMMPGTPVKEIVKKIKDTKIVFLSVVRTTDVELSNLTKQKNIRGFIQKPFDIKDLLKTVKEVCGE